MKHHYADAPTRSIVSLHPAPDNATQWWITRVSVLPPHRGNGIASRLLDLVCADADAEGITLWLGISPDIADVTALPYEELEAFYERRGFVNQEDGGIMKRPPR